MTARGELARVTGLSRVEAGRGNRALVAEGYAKMHAPGVYELNRRQVAGREEDRLENGDSRYITL
jgi:hypothetical protein